MQSLPKTQMPGQRQLSGSILRDNSRWQRQQRLLIGNGITTKRTANGIVISANSTSKTSHSFGTSTSLVPFTTRWYPYDDYSGEWQIYLPFGCASLKDVTTASNYTYIPVNDAAKDENGTEIVGWYRIETPEDGDATVSTSGALMVKEWTVYLLRKPYPRMMLSTSNTAYDTIAESIGVATIAYSEYSDEGNQIYRSTSNLVTTPLSFESGDTSEFAVMYECSGDASSKTADFRAYIVNNKFLLSREQVSAESTKQDVTGWDEAYIIFNHENYKYSIGLSQSAQSSDNNKTCIQIYEFKDNVVTSDSRSDLYRLSFIN